MFTYHSTLNYLVDNQILGGRICKWLLLFQEYDFEIMVKPGTRDEMPLTPHLTLQAF
jgi:hypothetical protein